MFQQNIPIFLLFPALLYNHQWKLFNNAIVGFLQSYKGKYHKLLSAGYGSLKKEGWDLQITNIKLLKSGSTRIKYEACHLDGTTKKFEEIVRIGITNMKAPCKVAKNWRIKSEKRRVKPLPNNNPYLRDIIRELRNDAINIAISNDVSSDIKHNWQNFLNWIYRFS